MANSLSAIRTYLLGSFSLFMSSVSRVAQRTFKHTIRLIRIIVSLSIDYIN